MNYDVAFSGSSGNAVRINDILFDIGISYKDKKMQELIDECNTIFVSHKHGDHLNLTTYKYLCEYYPLTKIYVNEQTKDFIVNATPRYNHSNLHVFHDRDQILVGDTEIDIYQTKHERPAISTAYKGILPNLDEFVFATDFYDFNDLPQDKSDYFFIEANHDENYKWYLKEIERLGGQKLESWILKSTGRHTTKQDALRYYQEHRRSKSSKFIPLHKSSRFYDTQEYQDQINDLLRKETNNG